MFQRASKGEVHSVTTMEVCYTPKEMHGFSNLFPTEKSGEHGCSPRVRHVCWGTLRVPSWVQSTILHFSRYVGLLLRRCGGQGPHAAKTIEQRGFLELRRDSRVTTWISGFLLFWPREPKLPFELRGKAGCCARTTARPKRPHLGVCPGPNSPLKGRQGSRDCTPDSLGESGLASRGSKGLRSPLEPRRGSLGAH